MIPANEQKSVRDAADDGLPTPRRYLAALAVWLAISMSVLDSAIANIALPTIARELRADPATAVWIINAYQLAITILLLPLAALGDRIGHRLVYLPALGVFVLGSLGCALASDLSWLIVARVVQGAGAAGVMSMNAALVRAIYPNRLLGRGMGYNALVLSTAAAIGPTIASMVLSAAPWPWLFAINVPVGTAALVIGWAHLPRGSGHGREPDYLSALLSAATFGLVVFGGETFAREGSRIGLLLLVAGLGVGALLLRREWRRPAPLLPVDLLRIPIFGLSILTSVASFCAAMLALIAMPFLLQGEMGRTVVQSGLLITPWPLAAGTAAAVSGRLADRHPAGLLGGAGLALLAVGLFALSRLGAGSSDLDIIWRMALCGLGFGLFQSPNNRAMIGAAPRERSGAAGGMLATARLLGQTAGAVAVASTFHWRGTGASTVLLEAAAIIAALAAGISLMRLRAGRPAVAPPHEVPVDA